jgi:hypothetical protein
MELLGGIDWMAGLVVLLVEVHAAVVAFGLVGWWLRGCLLFQC